MGFYVNSRRFLTTLLVLSAGFGLVFSAENDVISIVDISTSNCYLNSSFHYPNNTAAPALRCITSTKDSVTCNTGVLSKNLASMERSFGSFVSVGLPHPLISEDGAFLATAGECVTAFNLLVDTTITHSQAPLWKTCLGGPNVGIAVPFRIDSGFVLCATLEAIISLDKETGAIAWQENLVSTLSYPTPLSAVSLGPSGQWLEPSATNGTLRGFKNGTATWELVFKGMVTISTAAYSETAQRVISPLDKALLKDRFFVQACSKSGELMTLTLSHFPCPYGCFGRGSCSRDASNLPVCECRSGYIGDYCELALPPVETFVGLGLFVGAGILSAVIIAALNRRQNTPRIRPRRSGHVELGD